ncbi:MAG: 50S ribosomal protein L10 [Roseiflexaceae bacterium]
MPTQRKIESVADLTEKLSRTQVTLVADYRGLTVAEITDLRKRLRDADAELVVAKNTLTLMAAKATGHEAIEPLLSGPTALAFAYSDGPKVAKAINDFNRGPKKLVVRGGLLGNSLLSGNALDQVAKMPSRQQILAEVLGGISAPVTGVVGVLNGAISNIVYVLQAKIDQMQPAGDQAA